MAGDYLFAVEGLSSLTDIENLDEKVLRCARQALNAAADRGRTDASRQIRKELNFSATYLNEKLNVRRRASGTSLQATIVGQDRPTSLARFASNRDIAASKKAGFVRVKVGQTSKKMQGAFLMKLRNNNIGLAIRLKPGQTIKNKKVSTTSIGKGLYLLYGPSVDQAFKTVIPDVMPGITEFLEREFLRLMARDN